MHNHRNVSASNQVTPSNRRPPTPPSQLPQRTQVPDRPIRTLRDGADLERTVPLLLNNDCARRSLQAERWEERWIFTMMFVALSEFKPIITCQSLCHPEAQFCHWQMPLPFRNGLRSHNEYCPTTNQRTSSPPTIASRGLRSWSVLFLLHTFSCFRDFKISQGSQQWTFHCSCSAIAPQWDESDGYAHFRIFFSMPTAF